MSVTTIRVDEPTGVAHLAEFRNGWQALCWKITAVSHDGERWMGDTRIQRRSVVIEWTDEDITRKVCTRCLAIWRTETQAVAEWLEERGLDG